MDPLLEKLLASRDQYALFQLGDKEELDLSEDSVNFHTNLKALENILSVLATIKNENKKDTVSVSDSVISFFIA